LSLSKFSIPDILLFENEDYFLVNKPPFVATLDDRVEKINLLSLAKQYSADAQACHRLDKDTSGVLAFAKHPEAYRHLSMQFEHREVAKVYHAVVDGIHRFQNQLVDAPILKQDDGIVKLSKQGKDAQTYFTSLKSYRQHTLIECKPITGRMHQIRIHLASLGASITGDTQYGGRPVLLSQLKRGFNLKKFTEEQPLIKRMALHAFSLEFALTNGQKQLFEAPYPKDFAALVRQLEGNK
jgi:23S rRNA pseudouridine955/2504/2580 synthase